MQNKNMKTLSITSTAEERLLFEVHWLSERVRNLELIVHELMRDRVNKEIADGWLDSAYDKGGWTPSISQIEGRGSKIATLLDQIPVMQWPKKPNLE